MVDLWIDANDDDDDADYTVGIGDRQIEVTGKYSSQFRASTWIANVLRIHRHRTRAATAPIVAGVATFRWGPSFRSKVKNPYDLPLRLIAVCVGGTHCLILPADDYRKNARPAAVRSFLTDRRVRVIGMEIESVARELERGSNIRLVDAIELRTVVARAFGKEAVAAIAKGRAPALEELAEFVLGGIQVPKKPGNMEFDTQWRSTGDEEEEEAMHAAVDAFLACEIGAKSLEKIGRTSR